MIRVTAMVFSIQGDGTSIVSVLTHNWGMASKDITNGFPMVQIWSEDGTPIVAWPSAKSKDSVTLSHDPFDGELKVKVERQ